MNYLECGLNLGKVIAKLEKIPENLKKLDYVKSYLSCINIFIIDINSFLEECDLNILINDENLILKKNLTVLNITINAKSDAVQLKKIFEKLIKTVRQFKKKIKELIKRYKFRYKKNIENDFPEKEELEKIVIPWTEKQVLYYSRKMNEKNYLEEMTDEEILCHYYCTDSTELYRKEKYKNHRQKWVGPDTSFVCSINALMDENVLNNQRYKKYKRFDPHFVNKNSLPFNEPSKTFNNTVNSGKEYEDIREIIKETKNIK